MKTRRIVHAALALATVLLAVGCHRRHAVVAPAPIIAGTWSGTVVLPGDGGTAPSTLTLLRDGTFSKRGGSQATYSGTYSIKGNTLTETFKTYTVDGHTMTIPADSPNVETDTFVLSGDTLTLRPPDKGPAVVLTRVTRPG